MGLCQQEAQKEIDNVGALYCWLSYVNSLVLIAPFCFGCLVRLDPFFVNMLLSLLIKKKRGWGGGGGGVCVGVGCRENYVDQKHAVEFVSLFHVYSSLVKDS